VTADSKNSNFRYNEEDDSWILLEVELHQAKAGVTAMMVPKNLVRKTRKSAKLPKSLFYIRPAKIIHT
jgi:hypothetical protein